MKTIISLSAGLYFAVSVLADQFDESAYNVRDVIKRDVVVVGGGASGTFAAVRVRDYRKSVVLIERNDRLGGHTETYTDPASGMKIDYGVQAYHNDTLTTNFFKRFDVPMTEFTFPPASTVKYLDFKKGSPLKNFNPKPVQPEYEAQLDKYPYLHNGIDLPNPVPADLLLPWKDYIKKYNLQESAWATTAARPAAPGDLLNISALYVFNSYNKIELSLGDGRASGLSSAFLNNSALYKNARDELGSNVLLSSTVTAGKRATTRAGGVRLLVKTPTGNKLVIAKQLVLGMPPGTKNTKYFGLDAKEQGILSKIKGWPWYCGLISNTGLDTKTWYTNADTNTEYHVPSLPYFVWFKPTRLTGQFLYWYPAAKLTSQAQVESAAVKTLATIAKGTGVTNPPKPKFDAFASHTPFHPYVSNDDIKAGFYKDMNGLQGYRNTWYISQLMVIGTSQLWNNTNNMLPEIIKAAS